ncbi:EsaB/YukD family protein [Nocardioides sp.]|uniref:EsaB/YukD family protein n=1 Tax=Nocardioides sp. TaxID=35761 RepID=UPI0039E4411F
MARAPARDGVAPRIQAGQVVRVSVVAGARRVDLAVPPAVPVAELLPGLASTLAMTSYVGLRLARLDGSVLSEDTGLSEQVPDGSVLVLAAESPAPVHDDVVEALVPVVEAVPPWLSDWTAAARLAAVALLLALGCAGLALAGSPRPALAAALAGAAGTVALARRTPAAAVVIGWATTLSAAVAGWLLAPSPASGWASAGGAALAVGGVLFAVLDRARLWLLPPLMAAVVTMAVGGLLPHVPARPTLAALLVVAAVTPGGLPRLLTAGLDQEDVPVDVDRLARDAARARELLLVLSVGAGLLVVALAAVAPAVGATCALLVAVRVRHHRARAEILTALATAALATAVAAVSALLCYPGWRPAVIGAIVLAGVLLLAPPLPEPRRSWLLARAETGCLVALPPLLVLTTGVLDLLPWIR